jgi:hypothetical protein
MAKQADPKVLSVVEALQSTLVNNLQPFVFYNDPTLGKCLARVSGFPGERSPVVRDANENIGSGGQILFQLSVDHNNMGQDFKVKAPYSGDGTPGTFRLATDGDLSDHVNLSKLKVNVDVPVEEVTTADTAPLTEQPKETVTIAPGDVGKLEDVFDPADKNKDGHVSKSEKKEFRKENQ